MGLQSGQALVRASPPCQMDIKVKGITPQIMRESHGPGEGRPPAIFFGKMEEILTFPGREAGFPLNAPRAFLQPFRIPTGQRFREPHRAGRPK